MASQFGPPDVGDRPLEGAVKEVMWRFVYLQATMKAYSVELDYRVTLNDWVGDHRITGERFVEVKTLCELERWVAAFMSEEGDEFERKKRMKL